MLIIIIIIIIIINIISSSDSDNLQWSSPCPVDHREVDPVLVSSTLGEHQVNLWISWCGKCPSDDQSVSVRIEVASLHCSCCHILPFPWLYRDLCCHFALSHSGHSLLSSSYGVISSLARLATGRTMHPCSLPHCRWSLHRTGWWWCWCASPSFWSSPACCWSASIPSGLLHSFPQDHVYSLLVLVVVSTTV